MKKLRDIIESDEDQKARDRQAYLETEKHMAARSPEQIKADTERIKGLMKKHGFKLKNGVLIPIKSK